MIEYKPSGGSVDESVFFNGVPTIFLGGSIENGSAIDWQSRFREEFKDLDVILLNPRSDNWDPNIQQDEDPASPFGKQVTWEIDCQLNSDILVYNFEPGTISPISLMELGLFASSESIKYIICPDDYFRAANVRITVNTLGQYCKMFKDLDSAITQIKKDIS